MKASVVVVVADGSDRAPQVEATYSITTDTDFSLGK